MSPFTTLRPPLLAASLTLAAACASSHAVYDGTVTEIEALRTEIERIGVHQVGFAEEDLALPARGWLGGAKRGARYGATATVIAGLVTPVPLAFFFGLALSPAGALVGAFYGAWVAPSAKRVRAGEARLHPAVEEGRTLSDLLEFEIVRQGNDKTSIPFVSLSEFPFSEETVAYVLELVPSRIGLRAGAGIQPKSSSFLEVDAVLRDTRTREVLFEETFSCEGVVKRAFFEWAEDDGRRLAVEFASFPRQVAEKIIDDVFLVVPTEN